MAVHNESHRRSVHATASLQNNVGNVVLKIILPHCAVALAPYLLWESDTKNIRVCFFIYLPVFCIVFLLEWMNGKSEELRFDIHDAIWGFKIESRSWDILRTICTHFLRRKGLHRRYILPACPSSEFLFQHKYLAAWCNKL